MQRFIQAIEKNTKETVSKMKYPLFYNKVIPRYLNINAVHYTRYEKNWEDVVSNII